MSKLQPTLETILTMWGPPGQEYTYSKAKALVKKIIDVFSVDHFCVAFEKSKEKCKSFWHFHVDLIKPKFQITKAKRIKIAKICGHENETACDFTKRPESGLKNLERRIRNAKYCSGLSDKKDKHVLNIWKSPGFQTYYEALCEEHLRLTAVQEKCGGLDPTLSRTFCFGLMEELNKTPAELYAIAREIGIVPLRMYIAENLQKLEETWLNLRKLKALSKLSAVPPIILNKFQVEMDAIVQDSLKYLGTLESRTNGQLNVFIDPIGNNGKSVYQDYLFIKYSAQEFHNSSTKDIAQAYNYSDIINFNFTKSTDVTKINYSVIEALLDGKIFSAKYKSGMKRVPKPVVNLFMNNIPHLYQTLSMDRWNLYLWQGSTFTVLDAYAELEASLTNIPDYKEMRSQKKPKNKMLAKIFQKLNL